MCGNQGYKEVQVRFNVYSENDCEESQEPQSHTTVYVSVWTVEGAWENVSSGKTGEEWRSKREEVILSIHLCDVSFCRYTECPVLVFELNSAF